MVSYGDLAQRIPSSIGSLWMLWVVVLLAGVPRNTWGQILTLMPSLAVGERYDDNIFQSNTGTVDDFVTVVTPGIRVHYVPASDTELDVEYRPSFEFFADNSDQNHIAQRLVSRFVSPLTRRFSLNVSDELTITEEPGDRLEEIDEATGLRPTSRESRQRTTRNRATGVLEVQLAPKSTLGLLFDSLIDDVNVADEVDEFRYTVGMELGYLVKAARGTRASLAYDVTFHTFAANAGAMLETEDFRVHTVQVGFRHPFSATLLGNATIGYAIIESDDAIVDGDAAIISTLNIIKTLRTGEASFRYARQFSSGGGEGNVILIDRFVLSVSFRITPKITIDLRGNLSFIDFQEPVGQAQDRDRRFWTMRPGLTYEVLRFWRLSVAYDFRFTDFDNPISEDRTEHRLAFTSQVALRDWLFLDLTYNYSSRRFEGGREDDEFDRNEIMLTITYAPTFRF